MSEQSIESDGFAQDPAWSNQTSLPEVSLASERIEGVIVQPLHKNEDSRGSLSELLSTRHGPIEPIVHVYAVTAAGQSERAIVYHALQHDRLSFVQGRFRVILMDLRKEAPTFGASLCFEVGADNPCRVTIPPYVAHGVKNMEDSAAIFVNMPTHAFDRNNPDKFRYVADPNAAAITFEMTPEF